VGDGSGLLRRARALRPGNRQGSHATIYENGLVAEVARGHHGSVGLAVLHDVGGRVRHGAARIRLVPGVGAGFGDRVGSGILGRIGP